jgi:signal transduction histidine kinase
VKFTDFLRDKLIFIVLSLMVAGFSAISLYAIDANFYFALFVPSLFLAGGVIALLIDYFDKQRYYARLLDAMAHLDRKHLLLEIIDPPETPEGYIWYEVLGAATKSMNDALARSSHDARAYREYVELWVHEIKTPLAGLKLSLENSRHKALLAEVDKIEGLVEQALFYARSGSVSNDYSVRLLKLSEPVSLALKTDARYLIQHKISVEIADLDLKALADPKWLVFVLRQLIENSVKYGSKQLVFSAHRQGRRVALEIRDNGVGIPPEDLDRVFDKGFTGANGRRLGKSTGLGLYLCKKLCDKLNIGLKLTSEVGSGTTVTMTFPTK